ncbi:MAG: GatB/YqeY domain-containing protein [Melioribacteraceae bacterium]|nr:GatB/YqeY domain-containing protein [Melioribacteraceae bacterium]MCF8264575.1 GatB/YqeY domain-containing protein [Melioribacteraceae bacterium]MCF8432574.1 GatB/YqeY domain-containing protein [Melioribacteraceae bacterium]
MNLKDKINEDLKSAMKSKDKVLLSTVRSIRSLILEYEKSGIGKEMDSGAEIKLLSSAAKKRKESIEQFRNGGRDELAEKEEAELKIIESYLPKQLTDEEVTLEIKNIAEQIGAKSKQDFPKLMPASIKALKGRADGKKIKEIVEALLV